MKKFSLYLLLLTLSLNALASSINPKVINTLVEDYEYDLTVTWNDVLSAIGPRIDAAILIKLNDKIEFLKKKPLSKEETIYEIMELFRSTRDQGAAWNGEVVLGAVSIFIFVGLFVLFIATVDVNPEYCQADNGWVDKCRELRF